MFIDGLADFCSTETRDAYSKIYNVENYLRFIIKWELVAEHGDGWRAALGKAGLDAVRKLKDEDKVALIATEKLNIMSYLMLSDLRTIMMDEVNWPLFAKVWGTHDYLGQQLVLLNKLRAKVMHCRPLTSIDLATLQRTLDTLEALSRRYREQISAAVPGGGVVPKPLRPLLRRLNAPKAGESRWILESRSEVSRYWRLGLALQGGGFRDDDALGIFAGTGHDCLFAAADPGSGRLDLYVPIKIAASTLSDILPRISAIRPLDGTLPGALPADEPEDRFDGLFRLPIDLPASLRLPTGS